MCGYLATLASHSSGQGAFAYLADFGSHQGLAAGRCLAVVVAWLQGYVCCGTLCLVSCSSQQAYCRLSAVVFQSSRDRTACGIYYVRFQMISLGILYAAE